ncbi:MAG: O-antigen ligase family protein [bacterium]
MSFSKIGSLLVSVLLASLVIGQVLRFPLPGQGGGLLISDLAVVIILISALISLIFNTKKLPVTSYQLLVTITPFILWSLFTLIIRVPELGLPNSAVAFAYWSRLAAHLLLLPALLILFQDARIAATARRGLIITTTILILLGFLQLWLVPDFSTLTKLGWDPHQNRLTSTWLDPNFFGAFLAIMLPFIIIRTTRQACPPKLQRRWNPSLLLVLVALIIIALLLTQSRSALIALTLSTLIFSPLIIARALHRVTRARLVAAISSLLLILLLLGSAAFLLHDRLVGIVILDATARLRLDALKEVWPLAEQHALLGVGYNAYQFAAAKAGLISDFNIHSRAGADNSLLTLWITTGLIGVILFFFPWAFIMLRTRSLLVLFSFTTLLIHSQFVNSFLYSHLLITLIVITALALTAGNKSKFLDL